MAAIAKQLDWDVASQMGDLTRDEHAEYLRLLGEKQLRSMDGLKLYRPREQQRLFHVSVASQRILRGGVRCLSGDTMVFDPVAGTERRLDAISGPFHVQSLNPETGLPEAAVASEPFLKSFGSLYRVTLSNGQEFSATLDHRVLTTEGWLPLRDCGPRQRRSASFHLLTSSGTCQPASPQGAGRSSHTPQGCQGDCSPDRHPCGEQPQWASGIAQGLLLLQAGAREHTHLCLPAGVQGDAQECSPSYRRPSLPSMQGAVLADSRRDRGASFGSQTVSPPYSPSSHSDRDGRQSSGATGCLPRTIFASAQPASRFVADQPSGSPERGGVRLASLKYLRQGAIYDFEVLPHHNYVLAGIVHHNSGKSMSSFAETASAATTQPIIGWDGYPLPQKYPTNRPLLIWVVGYDERHIGGTIYRMLFKPGAFRIIQDRTTGEWRAWKPWELADKLREEETRPAPPLIPPRLID